MPCLPDALAFGCDQFVVSVSLHEDVQSGAFALQEGGTDQVGVADIGVAAGEGGVTVHLGLERLQAYVQPGGLEQPAFFGIVERQAVQGGHQGHFECQRVGFPLAFEVCGRLGLA